MEEFSYRSQTGEKEMDKIHPKCPHFGTLSSSFPDYSPGAEVLITTPRDRLNSSAQTPWGVVTCKEEPEGKWYQDL